MAGIKATIAALLAKSAGSSAVDSNRIRSARQFNPVDVANAIDSHQRQLDTITNALKSNPAVQDFTVTDHLGALIGWIGSQVVGSASYAGAWFKQIFIGGTSAATAVISTDVDGNVTINGATLILNANGITTEISNTAGAVSAWPLQASSLISIDNATGAVGEIDPFHIALTDGAIFPIVYLANNGGLGDVNFTGAVRGVPNPSTGSSVTIDAPTGVITIGGGGVSHPRGELTCDGLEFSTSPAGLDGFYDKFGVSLTQHLSPASTTILLGSTVITDGAGNTVTIIPSNVDSPGFSAGGVAGITASLPLGTSLVQHTTTINYGSSLSLSTSSAVTTVSGVGVTFTTGTFVTGVTLTLVGATFLDTTTALGTTTHGFTKGLLTS